MVALVVLLLVVVLVVLLQVDLNIHKLDKNYSSWVVGVDSNLQDRSCNFDGYFHHHKSHHQHIEVRCHSFLVVVVLMVVLVVLLMVAFLNNHKKK